MPDDYYDKDEVERIGGTRTTVQFLMHNPPETRNRLLKAYRQAMYCIDQVLWLAECYAQQTQESVFPKEYSPAIKQAHAAMQTIDSDDPNIKAVRDAMALIDDFRQMKSHHVSPDAIRIDICSSLKIKRTHPPC